jgi:hypothetical protein
MEADQATSGQSQQDRINQALGFTKPEPKQPIQQQEAPEPVEAEASQEPESASDEPQGEAPDETFEFEYEGAKHVLPKRLEKAVMQEKDYTQKSQALADMRKQLELQDQQFRLAALTQQFHKEVAPEVNKIGLIDEVLKSPIDWSAMSTDEVIRKKLQLDELKEQREELLKSIETKRSEWTDKQRTEFEKFKAQSLDLIRKKVPTWNDETVKSVRSHALSEGYTESEIASIADPRHALTLWKAYQYDQLQAKAQPTVSQARIAKPTPTNPMPQRVKEKLNYRKALNQAKTPEDRQRIARQRIGNIFSR